MNLKTNNVALILWAYLTDQFALKQLLNDIIADVNRWRSRDPSRDTRSFWFTINLRLHLVQKLSAHSTPKMTSKINHKPKRWKLILHYFKAARYVTDFRLHINLFLSFVYMYSSVRTFGEKNCNSLWPCSQDQTVPNMEKSSDNHRHFTSLFKISDKLLQFKTLAKQRLQVPNVSKFRTLWPL